MNDLTLKNETGIIRVFSSPVWLKAGPLLFFTIFYLIFFSPVLFTGHLLAPNDGLVQGIPFYYSPRTLWTNLLFSGYPQAADPQAQTWYPLSFLFSFFPNSWNAYMVSVYVLSAVFTYGYVFRLTQSRLAGLVSGLSYSMSGFMIGRLGQTPMVHAAVWFPLIIWSIEEIRQTGSRKWIAVGSFAVASCFLAGQPQIIVYSLPVAVAYALFSGWDPAKSRWKFYGKIGLMIALGIGLTAIQLLPAMELTALSQRAELVYSEFVRYSLSPFHSLTLLFPYLFGGGSHFYFSFYFGEGNSVEMVCYSGILTLMLAVGGVVASPSNRIVRFWLATIVVALVMAFGKYTPLGEWLFHMPVYQKFRAPIRHFLEISLAVSVLAGYGAAGLANRRILPAQVKKILWGSAGIMVAGLTMVGVFSNSLKEEVEKKGFNSFDFLSANPFAVGVPLLVFVLSSGIVFLWSRNPKSRRLKAIVLIVLVVDLGSFGWFHQWNSLAPPRVWLEPPENTPRYLKLLNESHQRLVPVGGVRGQNTQFLANLSLLWDVPSASGYSPLGLSRVRELLGSTTWGALRPGWESSFFMGLDILAVRYVFLPEAELKPIKDSNGREWTKEDLAIHLGKGCGVSNLSSVEFVLPQDFTPSRIRVVSHMVCAIDVPDQEKVLNIQLFNDGVPMAQEHLLAGRDTADWAYDCPDVRNRVGHKRPEIFESFPLQGGASACNGYKFYSQLKISPSKGIDQLKLKINGKVGILVLDKISLTDESTGRTLALRELTASRNWKFKEQILETWVYENLNAMPRAWLVPETVQAKPAEILRALQRSILPDGRPFDPSQTALIEEPLDFKVPSFDASGHVEITQLNDTQIEVKSDSNSESFLVMSDIYYPGWQVSIDDQPAHLYQTDYVLRGVRLPAGSHKVLFEFKPQSFIYGLWISLTSLLIVGIIFSGGAFRRMRLSEDLRI